MALPAGLLADFSVTHLPELHAGERDEDPLETITARSVVVFVTSAAVPVSRVEIRFLARARARTDRLAVVVTGVTADVHGRDALAVDEALLERAGVRRGADVPASDLRADPAADLRGAPGWPDSRREAPTSSCASWSMP